MPQVYRIDQGKKVSVFIPDHIWEKIQRKPKVFGRYKWELAPKPIGKPLQPIRFKVKDLIPDDDLAEKRKLPIYTEKDYRADLHSARLALKGGGKEKALYLYKQAYKFKKSLYVKTKIKELS